ncbi:hypothetical protein GCM10020358_07050 [Amorphoplanes nipponensis]|uniref:PPE family protein n=1 Tax=Actinoplanes nipponensis TaxID=135950 RepID=A0A919JNK7_9ACTN|nr:hypothetical protein [Actinoplanes nipponensis]GIE50109.1 hypothetical protein Ani05nite_36430 [Actinoplanes nipponensis]
MLIADGGGGYGGTHWTSKEVPAMWAAIANQDTEAHFEVVAGWRKTADLTLAHLAQVQVYRDNLASVWPPAKSPAAAAYIARLDKLMADLQATHDAASANYTAFSTVTLTLSLARQKLQELYNKYESNAKQNFAWEQKQQAAATSPTPTPSPSPSGARNVPPVSAAQQEELNRQARVIMYDLSNTVLSGQAALKKPQPYDPSREGRVEGDGHQRTDGGAGGFATPPIIPPPGGGGGGFSGGSVSSGSSHVTPVTPVTHTPAGNVPTTGGGGIGSGTGPILGGIGNSPVINPPAPGLPSPSPTPAPPPSGLGPVPGLIGTPGANGLLPPGGLPPGGLRTPQSGLVKPGVPPAGGRTTMPSGGVIGARPGSGMIGQMPSGIPGGVPGGRAPSAGRVNPVGGVIGQQGGGAPSGRGRASTHGFPAQNSPMANGPGRAHGRRQEGEQDRWDPDNPWSVDEGVDPVVRPPEDFGPIDPGPAIGYQR